MTNCSGHRNDAMNILFSGKILAAKRASGVNDRPNPPSTTTAGRKRVAFWFTAEEGVPIWNYAR